MKCLNEQDALLAAMGLARDGERSHLATCPICRAKADALAPLVERIAAAHEWFDRGHAEQRERLLASLAAEPQPIVTASTAATRLTTGPLNGRAPSIQADSQQDSTFRFRHSLGEFLMKHRIALSSAGLAAALLLAVWLVMAGRPLSAMEQVAAKIREAKSFSFEMSSEMEGKQHPGGKLYWQAPGTVRLEDTALPEGNSLVIIFPYHKPGIEIDAKHKTYKRLPAREGFVSPLMAVWKLGVFSGEADKDLPPRKVGDRPTRGFQIAAEKIDSGLKGIVGIWVDAETDLPALVEYEMERPKAKVTMHDFQWNTPLDADLFDVTPPEGFADKTPQPPTLEEKVKAIAEAFRSYSEICGGHYPRVKMVYGDVTIAEMKQQAGIERDMPTAEQRTAYTKILQATHGFAATNGILRDNSDAAYYGKTVGPADKEKVLLRWKLDSGNYEVIYGDLRNETVSAEQLKKLEAK